MKNQNYIVQGEEIRQYIQKFLRSSGETARSVAAAGGNGNHDFRNH
jgi:hypothetical protein